jgi:hypothetical protein
MENLFNELTIPMYFFNENLLNYITHDLLIYICNNLHGENNLLKQDLEEALTINANEEYI